MTSLPPRKFLFDRSFDEESEIVHTKEKIVVPTFSLAELEDEKKQTHDQAYAAGNAAALADETGKVSSALERIEASIEALVQNAVLSRQEQDETLREAVLAIARKILPDFNQKHGLQEVEAIIGNVISEMSREPRLVVRINEGQFDAIDHAVKAITEKEAYAGKVVLLADAAIAANDCRVEWADGGVERNLENLWQTLGKQLVPSSPVSSPTAAG